MSKPVFDSVGGFAMNNVGSTTRIYTDLFTSVAGGFPVVAILVRHGTQTVDAAVLTGTGYNQALVELLETTVGGGGQRIFIFGLPDGGTIIPAATAITLTLTVSTSSSTQIFAAGLVSTDVSTTTAAIIASIVSEADKSVNQANVGANELVLSFIITEDSTEVPDATKLTATGTSQTKRTTAETSGNDAVACALSTQTAEGAVTSSWTFEYTEDYAHTVSFKLAGTVPGVSVGAALESSQQHVVVASRPVITVLNRSMSNFRRAASGLWLKESYAR